MRQRNETGPQKHQPWELESAGSNPVRCATFSSAINPVEERKEVITIMAVPAEVLAHVPAVHIPLVPVAERLSLTAAPLGHAALALLGIPPAPTERAPPAGVPASAFSVPPAGVPPGSFSLSAVPAAPAPTARHIAPAADSVAPAAPLIAESIPTLSLAIAPAAPAAAPPR
jgi:hypothetical protein